MGLSRKVVDQRESAESEEAEGCQRGTVAFADGGRIGEHGAARRSARL